MKGLKCPYCGKRFKTQEALQQHRRDKHLGVRRRSISLKLVAIISIIIAGIGYAAYSLATTKPIGPIGSAHLHVDIKIYINGKVLDLSLDKYQLKSDAVHLEGRDGEVIHVHATGVTLGYFLGTLGMSIKEGCLRLDSGEEFCNEGERTLKVYVNNELIQNPEDYVMKDLDKILITYGDETEEEIKKQIASIPDKAKYFSKQEL